ncbi:ATP-binding cassette domain-containing protein [Hymenobacter sp. HMF4947]|uniref:ATP-binding cassette domain-containing protein n=1 Tax=Hymenobacter ginkgonis TaxID=2682976 RepID=A0A7K1THJ8_9BACT|nr:ABC transporter ATP-binding protein [Hymenobacter ginkgonis]MVN77874.1 ATP-binding cassette domain-containing protein [Hymenobacter ginkgonis]
MKTYLRLLRFARPYGDFVPLYIVYATLGIFFGIANFTLVIPLLNVLFGTTDAHTAAAPTTLPHFSLTIKYIEEVFNFYFSQMMAAKGKQGALAYVCGVIIVSVFFSNVFRYLGQKLLTKVRARVVQNLRGALYDRIIDLELGYFSNERKGDLMSRLTNDVHEVEISVVNTLTAVFKEPLTIIGFFVILFTMSAKLTIFTLILLPLSGGIIASVAKRLRRQAALSQSTLGSMLSVIDETLGSIRVIKGFNAQAYILGKFRAQNDEYARITQTIDNTRDLASPFSEFAGVAVVAGLLYYGGSLVLSGQAELGASTFITYIILFSQILVPAKALSGAFSNIQRGLVAGERVLRVIDTEPTIQDRPNAEALPPFEHQIELRDVSFSYGDSAVLFDLNLTVKKGQTVALVGPSGGGKSTLADLIPRFYDPSAGQLLIDGHDVRACTLHSVRAQMGIVTQESILFNDTIYNNIKFNTEATEAEVIEAAKTANAHDFIMQSADGYQTVIGDRGGRLSGGQRQRLSIARAILRNPPILILDEATSALDTESEKLVQEALTRLMASRTSLVIAHRLSTVRHADEIIVLQHGRIVERGTHDELLRRDGGLYQRLSQLQTNAALV